MTKTFIGLGSNLQHPIRQVIDALHTLSRIPETILVRHSSLYQTHPLGYVNQPDFINAVAWLDTQLSPQNVLQILMQIETAFGRKRTFCNAPRTLDLDLLYYEGIELHEASLTLPHPRMHERIFVMVPLAEIAADLPLNMGKTAAEQAHLLPMAGIKQLTIAPIQQET